MSDDERSESPEHDAFWEFERAGWERAAGQYQELWSSLTSQLAPPLLTAAGVDSGTRVIDVACGPGPVTAQAIERGARVVGVDFSPSMLQRAHAARADGSFIVGDAQQLPLASDAVDAVVMGFGVLHLSAPSVAFREAYRVLVPGGRYAFTMWGGPDVSLGMRIVSEAIETHGNTEVDLPEGPPYLQFARADACRRALSSAGFDTGVFRFDTVAVEWHVPTPDFLFRAHLDGGVRTAALLAAQPSGRLNAIKNAVETAVSRLASHKGYTLPFAVHVISVGKRG